MFDLRLIVQFVAVSETLSFSAAAARLGVAQPHLSLQIRKLESLLGFQLFERTTRAVRLTHHGVALLEKVQGFAREAEALSNALSAHRTGLAGRVRIGMVNLGEAAPRLPELIARFAMENQGAELETQPGLAESHEEHMREGSLDVAFGVHAVFGDELETVRMLALDYAVMLSADDPLAGLDRIAPQHLAGRRVAMTSRPRNPTFFDHMNAPLIAAGAIPVHVPELRRSLLRNAPDLIVTTIVAAPATADLRYGVVRRPVDGTIPLWLVMARLKRSSHPPMAERFWRFMAAAMAPG
jgi:DNA-binding transcriptional LysR family regulator